MTPFQELELSEFAMVLILLIARSPLVTFYVWSVISVLIEPHP